MELIIIYPFNRKLIIINLCQVSRNLEKDRDLQSVKTKTAVLGGENDLKFVRIKKTVNSWPKSNNDSKTKLNN